MCIFSECDDVTKSALVCTLRDRVTRCSLRFDGQRKKLPQLPDMQRFPSLTTLHLELNARQLKRVLQSSIILDFKVWSSFCMLRSTSRAAFSLPVSIDADFTILCLSTVSMKLSDPSEAEQAANFLQKCVFLEDAIISAVNNKRYSIHIHHGMLQHLKVSSVDVGQLHAPMLQSLEIFSTQSPPRLQCYALEHLVLVCTELVVDYPLSPQLEYLRLSSKSLQGVFDICAALPQLDTLSLTRTDIVGCTWSELLDYFPELTRLVMVESNLTDGNLLDIPQLLEEREHLREFEYLHSDMTDLEMEQWDSIVDEVRAQDDMRLSAYMYPDDNIVEVSVRM